MSEDAATVASVTAALSTTPPIPYCVDGVAPDGCCLLAVPNTSEWHVACASTAGQPTAATVPTLSWFGMALLAAGIATVAARRLAGWGVA